MLKHRSHFKKSESVRCSESRSCYCICWSSSFSFSSHFASDSPNIFLKMLTVPGPNLYRQKREKYWNVHKNESLQNSWKRCRIELTSHLTSNVPVRVLFLSNSNLGMLKQTLHHNFFKRFSIIWKFSFLKLGRQLVFWSFFTYCNHYHYIKIIWNV